MDPRHQAGLEGEAIAETALRRAGMKLLARRFNRPAGEIDLVMRDRGTIVFVEVKTQRSERWSDATDRVTPAKQRKLACAARRFLAEHRLCSAPCRFDVVVVTLGEPGARPTLRHFPDAFTPA